MTEESAKKSDAGNLKCRLGIIALYSSRHKGYMVINEEHVHQIIEEMCKEFPVEYINPDGTVKIQSWMIAVKDWKDKWLG